MKLADVCGRCGKPAHERVSWVCRTGEAGERLACSECAEGFVAFSEELDEIYGDSAVAVKRTPIKETP